MKQTLLLIIFLLCLSQLFAQNQTDSIVVGKKMGTVFMKNGQYLTPRQLLDLTKTNDEAYKEMKIAKSNYDIAYVFGFAGGFMVGWPIGTAIGGGKPNWALAGVGAGLIVVSIPFSNSYSKHAKNAITIYNKGLRKNGVNKIETRLGLINNGIALRVNF